MENRKGSEHAPVVMDATEMLSKGKHAKSKIVQVTNLSINITENAISLKESLGEYIRYSEISLKQTPLGS